MTTRVDLIKAALHYNHNDTPFFPATEDGEPVSGTGDYRYQVTLSLIQRGLLSKHEKRDGSKGFYYAITEGLGLYIKALEDVPIPRLRWVP